MGKLVFILLAALWPAILCDMFLCVCPTYWLRLGHFLHSSRYTTLLVLQLVCFGVANDLRFELDEILIFLDMTAQHLQPGVAHPAERPYRFGFY